MNETGQRAGFAGLVLAGGKSSRMGGDKARLKLEDGRMLIERAAAVLLEAGAKEIIVSTRKGVSYGLAGTREAADARDGEGPLAGIAAGLAMTNHESLLVLAVDLPRMPPGYLKSLAERSGCGCGIVPGVRGRAEPLAAVYPKEAAEFALSALEAGRYSLQDWVSKLHETRLIEFLPVMEAQKFFFSNWNAPEDCR